LGDETAAGEEAETSLDASLAQERQLPKKEINTDIAYSAT